jgi:murein DD-endopeptidase MepM/ murein hydrolase activator NlpD
MNFKKVRIISFLAIIPFAVEAESLPKDTQLLAKQDTITYELQPDSIPYSEQQEVEFQESIDTLYKNIDTFAWDNKMINSGHFESKNMKDTVRIVLVDSARHSYYYHPFKNYVSSGFGPRHWVWHLGMDIKLNKGDSVVAAFDGIVRVTKYDRRGFGNVVVIRHPTGLETIYGHLSKVLVGSNQKVKAGDLIGLGGSSGYSTGNHLHFEIRYLGEPFDPTCFIDFEKYKLKCDTLTLSRKNFNFLAEIRKAKYCSIRKGDTLYKIARRYGTSVTSLCKLNRITAKTPLRIGKKIRYQ